VLVEFEGYRLGTVRGESRSERSTGLGNAGEGELAGGVIDLPRGRPLGEALGQAGAVDPELERLRRRVYGGQ
jgi:hypothetical protein